MNGRGGEMSVGRCVIVVGHASESIMLTEKRVLLSTNVVPPPVPSQILGKTGYEMATHPAESTDWLNVLFAQVSDPHSYRDGRLNLQILQGYRNDMLSNGGEEGARQRIERWLNPENGGLSWIVSRQQLRE
jgi:maintenance of morphology protein 1